MLQKYCACHEKVEPRHTKSCNCHATWSLQNNTSVTWNLQPFHGFCVGGFKHRHHKAQNHCACHAKHIVSDPLQIHHACQRFCNPHELLRLPRILKHIEIPAPATRKALWTSKGGPRPWCFNDFDFQIALARRRGANFGDFNFQKFSDAVSFLRFWLPNRSRAQAWCKFCRLPLSYLMLFTILTSESLSRAGGVRILATWTSKSAPNLSVFYDFDFQIVLARRRGANFLDFNFQKCSEPLSFLRFWLPNRSRAQAWCKFFRSFGNRSSAPARSYDLTFLASEATKLWTNTAFRALPTRQILMSHISAVSHLRDHIS